MPISIARVAAASRRSARQTTAPGGRCPGQERNPCSGCGRRSRISSHSATVAGPIAAASWRMRLDGPVGAAPMARRHVDRPRWCAGDCRRSADARRSARPSERSRRCAASAGPRPRGGRSGREHCREVSFDFDVGESTPTRRSRHLGESIRCRSMDLIWTGGTLWSWWVSDKRRLSVVAAALMLFSLAIGRYCQGRSASGFLP